MEAREGRRILARAGEPLNPAAGPSVGVGRHTQVQGLLELAEHVQGILVPVEPNINFRRRLHGDLLLRAQRRGAAPQAGPLVQHRKGILLGAAAVGSIVSVVGLVIAFVLHHRHRGATRIAA